MMYQKNVIYSLGCSFYLCFYSVGVRKGRRACNCNQVYGASNSGYASHSFIELYNPTDTAVNLTGWFLQYKSSADGKQDDQWYTHSLSGIIEAKWYYLIRCGKVKKS